MSSGIRRNLSLSKAEKAHRPAAGGDAARTPPGAIRAANRRNPRGTAVSGGYLDSPKGWESSIEYVALLAKYKSGGYYTFNSKELTRFLNWKIANLRGANDGFLLG